MNLKARRVASNFTWLKVPYLVWFVIMYMNNQLDTGPYQPTGYDIVFSKNVNGDTAILLVIFSYDGFSTGHYLVWWVRFKSYSCG